MREEIIIYCVICLFVFILYGIDKYKAIRHKWRIPEWFLILTAICGVVGALAGMMIFQHKIRKAKFKIGVPLIFILELSLIILSYI